MPAETKVKRYNLVLPQEMFDQLEELAEQYHITVIEVLRRFIKLGFLAVKIEQQDNAALLVREGDREREIVILM